MLKHGVGVRRGNDTGFLPWTETSRHYHDEIVELLKSWELSHYGTVDGRPSEETVEAGQTMWWLGDY